jgi:hypothetical protein
VRKIFGGAINYLLKPLKIAFLTLPFLGGFSPGCRVGQFSTRSGVHNGSFQKRSTLLPRRKFLPSGGGGETKLFLIIVNVLGHLKGVGGLTSNFLRGGGTDVFWNDPIRPHVKCECEKLGCCGI